MENIILSSSERKEIKKRGFLVKRILSFFDFIKLYCLYLGVITGTLLPIGFVGLTISLFASTSLTLFICFLLLLIPIFYLLRGFIFYIIMGKFFYSKDNVYVFGKLFNLNQPIRYLKWIKWSLKFKENSTIKEILSSNINLLNLINHPERIGRILLVPSIILFLPIIILISLVENNSLFQGLIFFISFGGLIFLGVPLIALFLRQLVEHFHPLYAFGNLGEKIQSLTPQIESQSKLIQSEFEKDMNFGVLHSGFEKLSSTFSQIVSLVLKLENREKKANKGNLFDSTKYINSLRSDILTPLISLRTFLQKQKQELMNSQKELSRVRVGGGDESGNLELSSKRTESLMIELEKNIISLDDMIEKMGK